jgi:GTPase SAR1 family protein
MEVISLQLPLLPSMNSDAETLSENDLSFWNDRHLKFRVLILGRVNAGKTTILERLTGATMDKAEVWRDGNILPGQVRQLLKDFNYHV